MTTVKYERITLWTATQTYGLKGVSALDYLPLEEPMGTECKIIDWEAEDYQLVKVEETQAEATDQEVIA